MKTFSNTFKDATSFNQDVTIWNVSAATDMRSMFRNAEKFEVASLSTWKTAEVKNMGDMFRDATKFRGDLSLWNVSLVTDMGSMFSSTDFFNSNISAWNTKKNRDFSYMFYNAIAFNQDVSGWPTEAATTYSTMFNGATEFLAKYSCVNATNPTPTDLSLWFCINQSRLDRSEPTAFSATFSVPPPSPPTPPPPTPPPPTCGNGLLEPGEECDDWSNIDGNDHVGCSASCTVEPGFVCSRERGDERVENMHVLQPSGYLGEF